MTTQVLTRCLEIKKVVRVYPKNFKSIRGVELRRRRYWRENYNNHGQSEAMMMERFQENADGGDDDEERKDGDKVMTAIKWR